MKRSETESCFAADTVSSLERTIAQRGVCGKVGVATRIGIVGHQEVRVFLIHPGTEVLGSIGREGDATAFVVCQPGQADVLFGGTEQVGAVLRLVESPFTVRFFAGTGYAGNGQ